MVERTSTTLDQASQPRARGQQAAPKKSQKIMTAFVIPVGHLEAW